MSDALAVVGVSHRFGRTPVLDGVSVSLPAGQVLAILGTSGCGKTTLLRAIAGLLTPDAGNIHIRDEQVVVGGRDRVPIERRRIGLVFQDYALFGAMTVAENVAYGLGRADPDRVNDLLHRVGLDGLQSRYPGELSGGQQQRVALARALAPRPSLLLLDEPFANVDADRRAELGASLRETLAAEGRSAVLVTHDRHDALGLADQVCVLVRGENGGRVGQLGTPAEVYERPASEAVARLTGPVSPLAVQVRDGLAVAGVFSHPVAGPDGPGTLLLRPEHVLTAPGDQATVRSCSYYGATVRTVLDTPVGQMQSLCAEAVGGRVGLQIVGHPHLLRSPS